MLRLFLVFVLYLPLSCAAPRVAEEGWQFTVDTYLATRFPGQAVRLRARAVCDARGMRTDYVETRRNGRGGYRHVYACS